MKEENTKRTPITGRVRLMFKMLATFPLAVCLFSQIQANSQLKYLKIQKIKIILQNSHILVTKNAACEHRLPRRLIYSISMRRKKQADRVILYILFKICG